MKIQDVFWMAHWLTFGVLAIIFLPITLMKLRSKGRSLSMSSRPDLLERIQYGFSFPSGHSSLAMVPRWRFFGMDSNQARPFISITPNRISGASLRFREPLDLSGLFKGRLILEVSVEKKRTSDNFPYLTFCFVDDHGSKARFPLGPYLQMTRKERSVYRIHDLPFDGEGARFSGSGFQAIPLRSERIVEFGFEYVCEEFLEKEDGPTEFVLRKLMLQAP